MSFWNKVGKAVGTVVEAVPVIVGALMQEGAKKQASMQKEAGRRINNHERKVEKSASSSRMSEPDYAKKVQEEQQKIEKAKAQLNNDKEKFEKAKAQLKNSNNK